MAEHAKHFPDIDEYLWLIESSEDGQNWWPWSLSGVPAGAVTAWTDDLHGVLVDALALWFIAATAAELNLDGIWVRVCAWRLGRVVDGAAVSSTLAEAHSPAAYGQWLHSEAIAPDAVEVRTPYQAVRLAGGPVRDRARLAWPG